MEGNMRRQKILEQLNNQAPVSATKLAQHFQVSRQIIVGDIALLRAAGENIRATSRGYLLNVESKAQFVGKIACQHIAKDTKRELELIVKHGGQVIDVQVAHPIYGELTGNLDIQSLEDVKAFIALCKKERAQLLSGLTDGIHLHTIRCEDESTYESIRNALLRAGLLYEESAVY